MHSQLKDATYQHRVYAVLICDFLLVLYTRLLLCRLPVGRPRLLAALPAVAVTCALPLLFSRETEVVTVVAVAFLHVWLTNFKILGLAAARGPLTLPLTLPQFAAVLLAPITPQVDGKMHRVGSRGRLADSGGSSTELLSRFAAKTVGLCAVVTCLSSYDVTGIFRETLYGDGLLGSSLTNTHAVAVYVGLCAAAACACLSASYLSGGFRGTLRALGLYLFLGFFMDGPATAVTSLIGLRIAPHFNQPYLSQSVASFWGARWNLTAANTLRFAVYDPLCDGRFVADTTRTLPVRATQEVRAVAMMAVFVISGLIHEVMYWYTQGYMTGRWLLFFSLQGPLILTEMGAQRLIRKQGWPAPRAARVAVTLFVLMGLGHLYFFPPAVQGGLADRVCESIKDSFGALFERVAGLRR